jgi:hypothetical protein
VKRTNGHLLAPEAIDLGSPANMTIAVPSTEGHSDWVSLVDLIDEQLVDGKIVCPFHADTRPSCHVYDDHVHCFSCGAHVDAVDYLMGTRGINREQALRLLTDPDKPKRELTKTDDGATLAQALSIWDASVPIAGTRVIKYLADVRGIDTDALPTNNAVLRFHPKCPFGIELLPCLVARFSDVVSDEFAGIHRINLTSDVMAGAKATKLTLGRWPRPRVIKLWPASQRLFLGEGIVTVLSAATRIPYDDGEMMRPAWAAGPGGNMANIPTVPGVRELVLLVDHDLKGNGQKYAAECAQRWTGRNVVQMMPERPGADFNNVVLGT